MKLLKCILATFCACLAMSAWTYTYHAIYVYNNTDNYEDFTVTLNAESDTELTCREENENDRNDCNPFTADLTGNYIHFDMGFEGNSNVNLNNFSIAFKKPNGNIVSEFTFDDDTLACLEDIINYDYLPIGIIVESRKNIYIGVWPDVVMCKAEQAK